MHQTNESGLTLIEVVVATALFAVVSLAASHLFVWAVRGLWSTGAQTIALAAAQGKMEELHSLAWRFDDAGNRVSDTATNLTRNSASGGGPGLAVSPVNALLENVDGYVDYLDEQGQWVGTGLQPAEGAVFVRRWAVRALPAAPEDPLVLQVLVVPLANPSVHGDVGTGRGIGESLLTSARTRVR